MNTLRVKDARVGVWGFSTPAAWPPSWYEFLSFRSRFQMYASVLAATL